MKKYVTLSVLVETELTDKELSDQLSIISKSPAIDFYNSATVEVSSTIEEDGVILVEVDKKNCECDKCYFYEDKEGCGRQKCMFHEREDGRDIIFVKMPE